MNKQAITILLNSIRNKKKSYPQAKQMKNLKNLKSQVKKQEVIHRGLKNATTCGFKNATPNPLKFLKNARVVCVRTRGFPDCPETGVVATGKNDFIVCAGLKDGNGLLATRRTLRADLLGKEYRGIF